MALAAHNGNARHNNVLITGFSHFRLRVATQLLPGTLLQVALCECVCGWVVNAACLCKYEYTTDCLLQKFPQYQLCA